MLVSFESCRKSRKQVLSTYKHKLHIYQIFFGVVNVSRGQMVCVLSLWYLHPGFEPSWASFFFQKINWLNGHWNVTAIRSTEWSLNGDWNATETYLSCHHAVVIESPFSHHSVDWMLRFHPLISILNRKFLQVIRSMDVKIEVYTFTDGHPCTYVLLL